MWHRSNLDSKSGDETRAIVESCAARIARRLLFLQTGAIPPDSVVVVAVKRIMRGVESRYGNSDGLRRACKPNEMTPLIENIALSMRLG